MVPWRLHFLPRMLFCLAESHEWSCDAPPVLQLLSDVHRSRLPDTKICEDMHQHIRDRSRLQRYRKISRSSRMQACVQSGVFAQRKIPHVVVSSSEISTAPASMARQKSAHLWKLLEPIPADLKNIMQKRDWQSPPPFGQFFSRRSGVRMATPLQEKRIARCPCD